MAAAEVAPRPQDRSTHKRPFAAWVKRLAHISGNKKSKKGNVVSAKNNPYPQSGHVRPASDSTTTTTTTGATGYTTPPTHRENASFSSLPASTINHDRGYNGTRSVAPTVTDTVHSDAGYSRALTGTTAGGAMSSIDGAGGANSTFSSPNQSQHSLTTTLTTIQSSNALNAMPATATPAHPAPPSSQPTVAIQFQHQYPITAQPASAIPAHLSPQTHQPTTYASATAHNQLTDNASVLTLASSSKRRRRSMDTDASVRALAPRSVWGDSRESLPLSMLSGNVGSNLAVDQASIRPSLAGGLARDERASVYSGQGNAVASERNSYYAPSTRQPGDKKDANTSDGRSVNFDAKSVAGTAAGDGSSLRGYESSIRSGALSHGRNDSIPGSTGSPIHSPSLLRRPSGAVSLDVARDEGAGEGVAAQHEDGNASILEDVEKEAREEKAE